jgi:uncharacterized protein (TIGR02145 family)
MAEDTFTDARDGRVYRTVEIGSQVWLAENLNYDAPGSKFYENNPENGEKYGRLYEWEAAINACPPGWHLPSNEEWEQLFRYAEGAETAGKYLKAASGWAALLGGEGHSDGGFGCIGSDGNWWSSSRDDSERGRGRHCVVSIDCDNDDAAIGLIEWNDSALFSVRCIQGR